MKKNKALTKKSVDIEAEMVGLPVEPKKKKEKKDDLTDEIRKFLAEPITLDRIKWILLRLSGPLSKDTCNKAKITIYGLPCCQYKNHLKYIIRVFSKGFDEDFFLDGFSISRISFFSVKNVDDSMLKQSLRVAIERWLEKNPESVKRIE